MKHCGTQELTTERLVLRRMTTDDCEMMFGNWANDPEVTRYLRWEPHRDWVVTMAYLNEIVKQYDRPDFYDWGICDKVTGVLMGNISIAPAESCEREKPYAWKNVKTELLGGMYEIGYSLGKSGGTRAMPPKPPLPCAITGLARLARPGWPGSTPARMWQAAACWPRPASIMTTIPFCTALTAPRCPAWPGTC